MKHIISLILTILILVSALPVLADDAPSDWAAAEVNAAAEYGLVPSELRGSYTSPVTRAEFAQMAIRFFSVVTETPVFEIPAEYIFEDTGNGFAAAAYGLGIIKGRSETVFAPNDTVTRQEAAVMMANTLSACGEIIKNIPQAAYSDIDSVADWAQAGAAIMQQYEIMNGVGENRFAPLEGYTREQSIASFWRMYKSITKSKKSKKTEILTVVGGKLVADGKEVVLNGVNLGGWLLMESWMSLFYDPNEKMAYSDIIDILKSRFGDERADILLTEYENNFITSSDFARIAKLGFNCVRLPFWYRSFMTEDGEWLSDNHNTNPGFKMLDKAVRLCEKYGLYLILDMHGCPGGQSTNHSTGTIGKNELYDSEENLAAMERLWTAIAHRYKNNPYIAAYDIMNEPQNNDEAFGKKAYAAGSRTATERTNAVYDRMIKAIRKKDPNHIITVEGIWSLGALPNPLEYGWKNVMYQLHIYDSSKAMLDRRIAELKEWRSRFGVAVFVGEYNSKGLESYAADLYEEHSVSRAKWTYKTIGVSYDNWGLYNKNIKKLDITSASYEEIKKAFGREIRTENAFEFNQSEYESIYR